MSEMIERCITALMDSDVALDFTQAQARQLAMAVLKAIREPTEGMVERAFDGPIFQCAGRDEIRNGYRAMIDEALNSNTQYR